MGPRRMESIVSLLCALGIAPDSGRLQWHADSSTHCSVWSLGWEGAAQEVEQMLAVALRPGLSGDDHGRHVSG